MDILRHSSPLPSSEDGSEYVKEKGRTWNPQPDRSASHSQPHRQARRHLQQPVPQPPMPQPGPMYAQRPFPVHPGTSSLPASQIQQARTSPQQPQQSFPPYSLQQQQQQQQHEQALYESTAPYSFAENTRVEAVSHLPALSQGVLDQIWRPCTASRSIGQYVSSLRMPHSFRSLSERWHWIAEPPLETDLRALPILSSSSVRSGSTLHSRGQSDPTQSAPTLHTISDQQELSFEQQAEMCMQGNLEAYRDKPVSHLASFVCGFGTTHAELLTREQGIDSQRRTHIRDTTVRGMVADFVRDRASCLDRGAHFCLFRLLWGEAVDWPPDALEQQCFALIHLFIPGGRSMSAAVQGRSRGTSSGSNLATYAQGVPGLPLSPVTLGSVYGGDLPPHVRGEGDFCPEALPRGDVRPASASSRGSGSHFPMLNEAQNLIRPQLQPLASFRGPLLRGDRASGSVASNSSVSSQTSTSPESFRTPHGMFGGPQAQTYVPDPLPLSPRTRGMQATSHTSGYEWPPETIVGRSTRRILQNRQKSKRHYNRKKAQRTLLAEALIVFGQVFHVLRQIPQQEPMTGQTLPMPSQSASGAPLLLADTAFGAGIEECLSQRQPPPERLASLIGPAGAALLARGADASDPGSVEHQSFAALPHIGSSPSSQSIPNLSHREGGSSTMSAGPVDAQGIPLDLTITPALAAAGAAATMPALAALNTNERKRLSKLMQSHLEKQRIMQVTAIANHLLGALQKNDIHRIPADIAGVSVFANRASVPMSTQGGEAQSSLANGLDMTALHTAVSTLAAKPEVAAVYAYVQAWRSFRSSWTDLRQAEARLSGASQRPISHLLNFIDPLEGAMLGEDQIAGAAGESSTFSGLSRTGDRYGALGQDETRVAMGMGAEGAPTAPGASVFAQAQHGL